MKYILFYSDKCPDTLPFRDKLDSLGFAYETVNITDSMAGLKRFLQLRDRCQAFGEARSQGKVGVPALQVGQDTLVLTLDQLEDLKVS